MAGKSRITLTLAHSPDPDDAFMWWPLTGKIAPPGAGESLAGDMVARVVEPPVLEAWGERQLAFCALPADIESLNRRALREGDLEVTALSVRTWAQVKDRYVLTACGASFGDGFGPKVVTRVSEARVLCEECLSKPGLTIAIPGKGTTAFLMLRLLMREMNGGGEDRGDGPRFIELPFERIMGAVADGEADVGLVIHEGQLSFADSGLCLVADVGSWWKEKTGLMLPLGVNAVRRDLDDVHGRGTVARVAGLLKRSVAHAMDRWEESVRYTLGFAEANAQRTPPGRGRAEAATLERVDAYCRMYVTPETLDMGDAGREAIRRLLAEGAAAGLCEDVGEVKAL